MANILRELSWIKKSIRRIHRAEKIGSKKLFVFAKLPYYHTEYFQAAFGADDRVGFI